jgi:acyl-CoA synthetase (AMP-forming)/AMP-acid ligase II
LSTDHSVVGNLERSAHEFAERVAIGGPYSTISYSDLWRGAGAFAGHLERRGLRHGDRVALLMENSPEYVIAYYGALLAGGVVVPLNAAAKARDLAVWLRHSDAAWLVANPGVEVRRALEALEDRPRTVLVGESHEFDDAAAVRLVDVLAADEQPRQIRAPGPDELASILFTSGTTGQPKGVMLSHRNIAANTAAIVGYLGLTPADSIVSVLPFYYSYGNSVLHTHLAVGARVVLENSLVYPHLVVERLAKEHCSGFAGVPSTFTLLLTRVTLSDHDLSALRYVTQAGGPMSPQLTRRLREALPRTQLFVMYGQTEATARLTYLPPARLDDKLGSVGIAISGVEIEVRRDDGSVAAANETGEVWARGANVMHGYWRDPDTTAATVRDGWLKTGDAGYRDQEGFLYLVGRRSDIIKTGAHRVHPRDVEDVIAEIPGVAEVAAVGVEDELLGQAIKAFIVAEQGVTLDLMRIKAHVRAQLPNYKVPKHLEILAALPKTASGKVRRNELTQRRAS